MLHQLETLVLFIDYQIIWKMGQGIIQIQISLAQEIKKTYCAYQIVLVYKYF